MNKNIWNLYKNSERGKEAIALFTFNEGGDYVEWITDICSRYSEYFGTFSTSDWIVNQCGLIYANIFVENLFLGDGESSSEYFEKLIDSLEISRIDIDSNGQPFKNNTKKPFVKRKDYKGLCDYISALSILLFTKSTNKFIPVLFGERFDVLLKTLDVLEIPMPELPAKSDKRGRLLLYNELNKAILQFAEKNELTIEETCACIYDFALMLMDDEKVETEMPEPTNIWLTGGSKEDYKTFLKNPIKGEKSVWTCNENTKRGDIIVMYVLSPHSCIQSIWRADIDGVYTPFNYYNSRTRATDGIVVPHITLNELKADPYFSQLPITRKNFQGVNGVQFSANDYKELQRLLKAKGFDVSTLPQLYSPDLEFAGKLKNEKDVEEKLLIPLLAKLGYSKTDWTRQLSQKIGRKEKAIPDFVFLPTGETHFQNAPLVIEAKYDMSSALERTKSYNQALSYARILNSPVFGICDKDRLIIYKAKKGYFDRFNPVFEKHWQSIGDAEVFRQLKLLIGKETIEKQTKKANKN